MPMDFLDESRKGYGPLHKRYPKVLRVETMLTS